MKLNARQLDGHLARELAPAYLVAGGEPLLVSEAAAQIRARARRDGFDQREYHFVDRGFKWPELAAGADNLSLFASRRVIELHLPTPRPGDVGGRTLRALVERPDPDRLLLVSTGKLDASASRSAWVGAIGKAGVVVQVWPIERPHLPAWIGQRATSLGLRLSRAATELMADRVEGNLLAADQEVRKLVLLLGEGSADDRVVQDAVASNPRFDVFRFADAVLAGNARRALRILDGLRAEGVAPTLVLWAVSRDLCLLAKLKSVGPGRAHDANSLTRHGVWRRRQPLVKSALQRFEPRRLTDLLVQATEVDRVIKGVQVGNPWQEMTRLIIAVLRCSGGARGLPAGSTGHT